MQAPLSLSIAPRPDSGSGHLLSLLRKIIRFSSTVAARRGSDHASGQHQHTMCKARSELPHSRACQRARSCSVVVVGALLPQGQETCKAIGANWIRYHRQVTLQYFMPTDTTSLSPSFCLCPLCCRFSWIISFPGAFGTGLWPTKIPAMGHEAATAVFKKLKTL